MKRQKDTILIFRIGSLGDTLVALPAFHLIRQQYPTSRIVLLTNTPMKGMVKVAPSHQILIGSGLVDDYIEYPHKTAGIRDLVKLVRTIRELQPSATFYLVPPGTESSACGMLFSLLRRAFGECVVCGRVETVTFTYQ